MGDNPERLNTEASFAALCGVSPHRVLLRPAKNPAAQPRRRPPGQHRPAPHRLHPPCATTRAPRRITNAAPRRARPDVRSSDASSDIQPERSST
ncbi:hypothetical protein ACGF8E_00050 [Streptomyces tendae]|uniref:hypothetical protein n=1 Tax=Streptomyces tendae TaxID=1932 RepID=UPI00371CDB1C